MAEPIDKFAERIKKLSIKLSEINSPGNKFRNRIITASLKAVEGNLKRRIFNDGLDANLLKIGKYSTKPTLAGASSFRTKSAAAKVLGSKSKRAGLTWVTVGAKGKRKNLYVEDGGYKAIRDKSGLQSNYVDLEFTGDLRKQIKIGTSGGEKVIGHTNDKKAEIAKDLEEKYGKPIFKGSEQDIKIAEEAVIEEVNVILAELLA